MKTMTQFNRQQGAALIVGLILMVVVTVLAISGMNTATTELAMARNDQHYETAFQAAETGLDIALGQGTFPTAPGGSSLTNIYNNETVTVETVFEEEGNSPDEAYTLNGGVVAYHFISTSTAESRRDPGNPTDRDSFAEHSQAFYVIGPAQTNTITN